jgi:hypothetical protein
MNGAFFFSEHSGESSFPRLAGTKERNDRRTFYRSRELIDIKRPVNHDSYITLNIRNVNPKIQVKKVAARRLDKRNTFVYSGVAGYSDENY